MAPSKHAKSEVRSCLSEELVAIRTFSSCHLARSDAWNLHAYAFTEESDTWTCPNQRHRCDRQSDRRTDGAKATRHNTWHMVDSSRVNLVSEALTLPQPPSFTSSLIQHRQLPLLGERATKATAMSYTPPPMPEALVGFFSSPPEPPRHSAAAREKRRRENGGEERFMSA